MVSISLVYKGFYLCHSLSVMQTPSKLAITGIDQLREEISELLKSVEERNKPEANNENDLSRTTRKQSSIENSKLHIIGLRTSLKAAQDRIEELTEENARLRREAMGAKRQMETKQIIMAATDCYKLGNKEKSKIILHLKDEIKVLKADKDRMRDELATLSRIIKTVLMKN